MRMKVTHRCGHAIEPFIKFISFFIAHAHTKATLKWGESSGTSEKQRNLLLRMHFYFWIAPLESIYRHKIWNFIPSKWKTEPGNRIKWQVYSWMVFNWAQANFILK